MRAMGTDEERDAARRLARQAGQLGVCGREPWRQALLWISRGRFGRHQAGAVIQTRLSTPWRDTPSWERGGWRTRAAYLDGDEAFAVDYRTCSRCRLGWVEWPYTSPEYQRCGLASAGLAAVRAENPGLSWSTMGGHERDSRAFWDAAGEGVPGAYRQRDLCEHVTPG